MIKTTEEILKEWFEFSLETIGNNRYFPKNSFLNKLDNFLSVYEEEISFNDIFYRARKFGINEDKITFTRNEMGAPPNNKTINGRANPEGISYLYLASNKIIAISEVRPWVDAEVYVAECRPKQNLKIINLSKKIENNETDKNYLKILNFIFYTPIDSSNKIDYIPTQIISEFIKQKGFEGIKYSSSYSSCLNPGFNLVIFNKDKIEITDVVKEYRVYKQQYSFNEISESENIRIKAFRKALEEIKNRKI